MKKITTKYLKDNITGYSTVSKTRDKTGNFIFRKGFFYCFGQDQHSFADSITNQLSKLNIEHEVVDKGEKFVTFRGGDSVAQGSHWWVTVKINKKD